VQAIVHCLETTTIDGPVNLTAPQPVRFREFAKELGRVLRRPAVVPLPGFALKAIVGPQFADEAILVSNRVLPTTLLDSGEFSRSPRRVGIDLPISPPE
jgi:NAD dependent epimerase/dehydratase family enzyme